MGSIACRGRGAPGGLAPGAHRVGDGGHLRRLRRGCARRGCGRARRRHRRRGALLAQVEPLHALATERVQRLDALTERVLQRLHGEAGGHPLSALAARALSLLQVSRFNLTDAGASCLTPSTAAAASRQRQQDERLSASCPAVVSAGRRAGPAPKVRRQRQQRVVCLTKGD